MKKRFIIFVDFSEHSGNLIQSYFWFINLETQHLEDCGTSEELITHNLTATNFYNTYLKSSIREM